MFVKDSSILKVDSRISPRDVYRRRNFLDHDLFLHKPQDKRAIVAIRVDKLQDLIALRRQSFFRISTILLSIFICIYLPSKSVILTRISQHTRYV